MVGNESDKRASVDGSARSNRGDDSSRRELEMPLFRYFRAMVILFHGSLSLSRSMGSSAGDVTMKPP